MSARQCWDCKTTFYTEYGAIYCNVCNQARKNREYQEEQAREDRYRAEQIQAENARAARALQQAEYDRIAAINYQTKVIAEGAITSKEAYNHGYNYIDKGSPNNNPANLDVKVSDWGSLQWTWDHIYLTDRLREQFRQGLQARLNKVSTTKAYETMRANAKWAGRENALGTFPTHFTLYTGVKIGTGDIPSVAANTDLKRIINEKNGEVTYTWNVPFPDNDDLNYYYQEGVEEVAKEENTPLKRAERLATEVVAIKKERWKGRRVRMYNRTFKLVIYTFLAYSILQTIAMFTVAGVIASSVTGFIFYGIWELLKTLLYKWQMHNLQYL